MSNVIFPEIWKFRCPVKDCNRAVDNEGQVCEWCWNEHFPPDVMATIMRELVEKYGEDAFYSS